jgi:c(7)-type cytochrome triheme protein
MKHERSLTHTRSFLVASGAAGRALPPTPARAAAPDGARSDDRMDGGTMMNRTDQLVPPARLVACGRPRAVRLTGVALAALALLASAPAHGADTPRPAPVVAMRLPADIVYGRAGSDSAVVFSHTTHVALAGDKCTGCHPQTFHILSRGPHPSHPEMLAGKSCGICHDGKQSFSVRDSASCATCHSGGRAAQPAAGDAAVAGAPKLPAPHAYKPSEASPGRVTFRHETHMKGGATCASCHPKLFRMASAPAKPGGGMHEKAACGACHDGKQAFAAEDGESCGRCHIEGGGGR